MIDPITKFLWTLWPLVAVLSIEHILLVHHYHKTSSLQRLAGDLRNGSFIDIVYMVIARFPWKHLRTLLMALTVPGLLLIILGKLRVHLEWSGLLAAYQPDHYLLAFLIWLLVLDFGNYATHWLLHNVPVLWRFHKLHHAAEELNILVGARVSFAEKAMKDLVSFALLGLLFGVVSPQDFVYLLVVRSIIDMVQHSDLPWDYGFLGYLVVGPRFHRMHHSNDARDFNANYGNIFSFWDHLFGTIAVRYKWSKDTADEVQLGLDTKQETKKFNTLSHALLHETFVDYARQLTTRSQSLKTVQSRKTEPRDG